jgi:hypothetical protein
VWIIPGDGPKTQSGSSPVEKSPTITPTGLVRGLGGPNDAVTHFRATFFTPGSESGLGTLVVGAAGDVNNDGVQDFIIGAPDADPQGRTNAGKVFLIYGSRALPQGEIKLSDVGHTVSGLTVEGAEAGDRLGSSVGGGFDVNADGVADALAGAPFADSLPAAPLDGGETYVISPLASDEVVLLTLSASVPTTTTFLEWTVSKRAFSYNVYRGLVSTLKASGGVKTSLTTKLACGINTDTNGNQLPDTTDAAVPSLGDAFFYLITGTNLSGEGPLGPPGAVPLRVNDSQCP